MIKVDLNRAKDISHEKRRQAREQEFAPLDIKATIPHLAESIEAQRQEVREKYADIQTQIEKATCVDDLKSALENI